MLVRALAIIALISLVAEGGQWERRRRREPPPVELTPTIVPNFSFARVRFHSFREGRRPGWSHDYPRAERNLLRILSEVTDVYTEPAAHTIVPLDSPDLMLHPLAYFSEPGHLGDHARRNHEFSQLSRERRICHLRRLRRTLGLGELRSVHGKRLTRTPLREARARGPCVPELLPYQDPRNAGRLWLL